MAQDKISMPSGQGGLMRYFDDYKSKISIKPGHVIVLVIAVVIIILLLHAYGNSFLGL
jgi:preprotein translocase subunit Sec61beta